MHLETSLVPHSIGLRKTSLWCWGSRCHYNEQIYGGKIGEKEKRWDPCVLEKDKTGHWVGLPWHLLHLWPSGAYKMAALLNKSHRIPMTKSSCRISKRSFSEVPAKMVCHVQRLWIRIITPCDDHLWVGLIVQKNIMLWHTSAYNTTRMNEEVLERQQQWKNEVDFCLFCF